MSSKTAAIIIIGNEILSGRTQDINIKFIACMLNDLGIKLLEVAIIPDSTEVIVAKVQSYTARYDYIFTTGGIGPTHDDITAAAVAQAFGQKLLLNQLALSQIENYYHKIGQQVNDARLKMAYIPQNAELIHNNVSGAPGFKLHNVFVLAGVPHIMQDMFHELTPMLEQSLPIKSYILEVAIGESLIADKFAELQQNYDAIEMGSYPFERDNKHLTNLILRSNNYTMLTTAFNELQNIINILGFPNRVVVE